MILSLKTIKKIEALKVEIRLFLKKLSVIIHMKYEALLLSQHEKRAERMEFIRLEKKKIIAEAVELLDSLEASKEKLAKERDEIAQTIFGRF